MSESSNTRVIDLDVTRAIALIGVCLMNYYGYLVLRGSSRRDDVVGRLFDPWNGPFATRFAATFVTVAGMGIALMARRALKSDDPAAVHRVRWTLVRRGVLLYLFGYVFNWVWPGTILFFYGAFFVMSIGASLMGYMTITFTVVQWFERRRATAISLTSAGLVQRSHVASARVPGR
mgnify:CR=1 FL=1